MSSEDKEFAVGIIGLLVVICLIFAAIENDSSKTSIRWIPTSFNGHNYLFNSVTGQQYPAIPLAYHISNETYKGGYNVSYSGCFQIQSQLEYWEDDSTSITFSCQSQLYPFTQQVNATDTVIIYWGYLNGSEVCLAPPTGCNTNIYLYSQMDNITYSESYGD